MKWTSRAHAKVAIGAMVLGFCAAGSGKVLYVDDDAVGVNDGTSWSKAFVYLQDALDVAHRGDEIHIAQGVYTPDKGMSFTPLDRDATFELIDGVTLLGGYAGILAMDPNTRDIDMYETILSGDLKNDDGPDFTNTSDNSRLGVVTASGITNANTIIDGFTITEGHFMSASRRLGTVGLWDGSGANSTIDNFATGNHPVSSGGLICTESCVRILNCRIIRNRARGYGGGLYGVDSFLVLEDCVFEGNSATSGGGLFCSCGTAILRRCEFINNVAEARGGAVYIGGDASIAFHGSLFESNSAKSGGALFNYDGEVAVNNCHIFDNAAEEKGGGMYNWGEFSLINCHFAQNTALTGGALQDYNSESVITDCTFEGNHALGYSGLGGAGVFTSGGTSHVVPQPVSWGLTFIRCRFIGNRASGLAGGGLYCGSCAPTLVHCLFAGNLAGQGGAIYSNRSKPKLSNCTMTQNRALNIGAICEKDSRAALDHCIVWGHEGIALSESVQASYSDIEGGWPGRGNIDVDPLFSCPGYWECDLINRLVPDQEVWVDGDYHLQSQGRRRNPGTEEWIQDEVTSPCIDAGDPEGPIGDEPFPNGGIANLGAYGGSAEASKSYFGDPLCEKHLAGDINGDCKVGLADLLIVILQWTEEETMPTESEGRGR